jgi:hypothetical protein
MGSKKGSLRLYELKLTLLYLEPMVWRRVRVPCDITLAQLHDVIQVAMRWDDDHLHEFIIGRKRYGIPEPDPIGFGDPAVDEGIVRLNGVAKPKAKFVYLYDFGDDWTHEVRIERELESESGKREAICVAGENACPPEDCGGVPGYLDKLDILADAKHEDYGRILEWLGDDFDPRHFDADQTNKRLRRLKV